MLKRVLSNLAAKLKRLQSASAPTTAGTLPKGGPPTASAAQQGGSVGGSGGVGGGGQPGTNVVDESYFPPNAVQPQPRHASFDAPTGCGARDDTGVAGEGTHRSDADAALHPTLARYEAVAPTETARVGGLSARGGWQEAPLPETASGEAYGVTHEEGWGGGSDAPLRPAQEGEARFVEVPRGGLGGGADPEARHGSAQTGGPGRPTRGATDRACETDATSGSSGGAPNGHEALREAVQRGAGPPDVTFPVTGAGDDPNATVRGSAGEGNRQSSSSALPPPSTPSPRSPPA